jgi:murein L,D-transpeptidase YcbB/YkuD
MRKFLLLSICILFNANSDELAIMPQLIKRINAKPIKCTVNVACHSPLLSSFYKSRKYAPAWVKDGELTSSGISLIKLIQNAYMDGLDPGNYHINEINAMAAKLDQSNPDLAVNLELTLSDGLFLYLNNLVYGLQSAKQLYLPSLIAKSVNLQEVADKIAKDDNDVNEVLNNIMPKFHGYTKLREKLADYYAIAKEGGWKPIPDGEPLKKGSKGNRVLLLQERLQMSGELADIDNKNEFDNELKKAVIKYQKNHGLEEDGIVSNHTLNSLNIPIKRRILQIELNMDRMRHLPDTYPERYVQVNIPDYSLKAVEDGKVQVSSSVVVGRPDKKTCVVDSKIILAELNPYWNIPSSIVKEILPEVKADPDYLTKNGIKIFEVGSDKRYIPVDPDSIDWNNPNPGIFNLRFREDPGVDNALGRFKFMFPNRCGIYLHDSLAQSAFDKSRRGLSHGCIRIAEVDDFADYLLKPNGWDSKRLDTEVNLGKNKFIKLTKPTQLYIIYLTAWYDKDTVQFRDDIYNYDKLSVYPFYLAK